MRLVVFSIAALLLHLLSFVAHAHDGGSTGYAEITIDGKMVRYRLTVSSIPPGPLATQMGIVEKISKPNYELLGVAIAKHLHLVNNGVPCEAGPRHTVPPEASTPSLSAQVDFVCHERIGELRIRDDVFDVLGDDIHILARIDWSGGSQPFVFRPEDRETTIKLKTQTAPHAASGMGGFFVLGIEHILTGFDHVLFLLALILCGGGLIQILKIVTAFTVAHSITLGLAALDIISPPGRLVEAMIALSIAYVAAENIFPRYAVSRRWTVSFLFGAVHGMGFSEVLRNAGLTGENLLWSLAGFNIGVEVGQAALVIVAVPILLLLRNTAWERRLTITLSTGILAIGVVLFLERVLPGWFA